MVVIKLNNGNQSTSARSEPRQVPAWCHHTTGRSSGGRPSAAAARSNFSCEHEGYGVSRLVVHTEEVHELPHIGAGIMRRWRRLAVTGMLGRNPLGALSSRTVSAGQFV
jgi:hypothetical protein